MAGQPSAVIRKHGRVGVQRGRVGVQRGRVGVQRGRVGIQDGAVPVELGLDGVHPRRVSSERLTDLRDIGGVAHQCILQVSQQFGVAVHSLSDHVHSAGHSIKPGSQVGELGRICGEGGVVLDELGEQVGVGWLRHADRITFADTKDYPGQLKNRALRAHPDERGDSRALYCPEQPLGRVM